MKPKVTVLTCVYNGLPYLKDSIESILTQTYSNFEYLIIDDASSDENVVKLIESYNDSRINFVKNEENLGVSNTFNKALRLIKTPYVVRADQDDVNLPDRIEKQISYLEKNTEIDVVCSWEYVIDSDSVIVGNWKRKLENYGSFIGHVLTGICPIWHPSITFRTQIMIDAGGFNPEYTRAEDFEVTMRIALKRYNAYILPEFHLLQRQHENSQSSEFNKAQVDTARRIHREVISSFSTHPNVVMLGDFLRLEMEANNHKLTKKNFIQIVEAMHDFISNVSNKQKLAKDELKSFKKVVYRRVGFGIKYASVLVRLPSFLFYTAYYLLSPLQISNIRLVLSNIYRRLVKISYIFK
jgi:glycosyltransferase involved in cell wall biosynthesis